MNKTSFKKYISYVKEKKKLNIEDQYIEKDYFISLFLSNWQKQKEGKKTPNLDKLVFKGGTLLARNYLNYPRISEDLDFTYEKSNDLRKIKSKNIREKNILKLVKPIINDINLICSNTKFDFKTDRKNSRYITVRNSRAVYLFNIYYNSLITGETLPIKIELNFLEELIHKYSLSKINNILESDLYLKSIGYNLSNITIKTYQLDEIINEKYRAILTRGKLKERDILDLYHIHKKCKDIFNIDNKLVIKKIKSSFLISQVSQKNLSKNCHLLNNNNFGHSDDDIKRLSLVEIDENDYTKFRSQLFQKLNDICKINKI